MRDGKCRSCGSLTVFARQNGIRVGDAPSGVFIHTSLLTTPVHTVSFLCASCGYFEHYVTDRQKLAEVAHTWTRVTTPTPAG
jgi:DNA-directed RNA polymerase subunit M/transcription elongation factor TFIIS